MSVQSRLIVSILRLPGTNGLNADRMYTFFACFVRYFIVKAGVFPYIKITGVNLNHYFMEKKPRITVAPSVVDWQPVQGLHHFSTRDILKTLQPEHWKPILYKISGRNWIGTVALKPRFVFPPCRKACGSPETLCHLAEWVTIFSGCPARKQRSVRAAQTKDGVPPVAGRALQTPQHQGSEACL